MRLRKTAEDRKAELIAATIDLADRIGPDRLTTLAVANAVGITQAAVFRHFPTKRDLWLATVASLADRLTQAWDAATSPGRDAVAALEALVLAHLRVIAATPALPAILFSRELHASTEGLREAMSALLQSFHARLADVLAGGRRAGLFRRDLDVDTAAFLTIGMVQGIVIRWSLSGRTIDMPAEGCRMLETMILGLLPPAPTKAPETNHGHEA